MHIDRIPVYRVYQRAIDLELYHEILNMVLTMIGGEAA